MQCWPNSKDKLFNLLFGRQLKMLFFFTTQEFENDIYDSDEFDDSDDSDDSVDSDEENQPKVNF